MILARSSGRGTSTLRHAVPLAPARLALSAADTDSWLDRLDRLPSYDVTHESVMRGLDAARDEFGS